MKKLCFAFFVLAAMAGCKKETTPAPLTPAPAVTKFISQLVTLYNGGTPETEIYAYDAKGRIASISDDIITSTFDYVSETSLVVTERNNADNSLRLTKECVLNAKGYVTNIVFKNSAGVVTYNYGFTYNDEGYIIRKVGSPSNNNDFEVRYTIAGGNYISQEIYYNGVLSTRGDYTYDNNAFNTMPNPHGYWRSYSLFGKTPRNRQVRYRTKDAMGAIKWDAEGKFEMDADGYPVKETRYEAVGGNTTVYTYSY